MFRSVRLVILAMLLTVSPTVVSDVTLAEKAALLTYDSEVCVGERLSYIRYYQERIGRPGPLFPRWNDLYVVVFAQEMLV
ncbi:hypothetical protein [Amphritea sp.]|uniref:hypothetical protein n=1 Tax=Amphritea sp. TaxID=1872502 RepID=UPI003A8D8D61